MEDKKMLNEEELEKVTGGGVGTIMICSSCGFQVCWPGIIVSQRFDCTKCGGKGTLRSTSTCYVKDQPIT